MEFLIIGNSAAGLFAAEEIRRHDIQSAVTILTAETAPWYSRCLTTYYLANDIALEQIYLRPDNYSQQLNLKVVYNSVVTKLDSKQKTVITKDGQAWNYDKLLIATGASATKLNIPGSGLPEVFTLRTLDDALKINDRLQNAKSAAVIGGGLVALKSAYALLKRGLKVTVIVSSNQVLSQMLDYEAAGLIAEHLTSHGMNIILGANPSSIKGENHVRSVLLSDGREIPADLVVIGKGVKPNTGFLSNTGITLNRGIRVNNHLETNLPDIYAAGDAAETWDCVEEQYKVNATWPNATLQGRIAGANMTGRKEQYHGSMGSNSVDFFGISMISAGITKPPLVLDENKDKKDKEDIEDKEDKESKFKGWREEASIKYSNSGTPNYQKLIWKDNKLKGYVLLGDTSRAGTLTTLIRENKALTIHQQMLLKDKRVFLSA